MPLVTLIQRGRGEGRERERGIFPLKQRSRKSIGMVDSQVLKQSCKAEATKGSEEEMKNKIAQKGEKSKTRAQSGKKDTCSESC